MKYLSLLWANLKRRKLRTIFTLASIIIAFLLFGLLAAMQKAFLAGVDIAGADRLVTIHKVTLIQPLPLAYQGRIQGVPGVKRVAHATWFGGMYQDSRNEFGAFPVDENYMDLYPEFVVPEEQLKAWKANRRGMLAGKVIAAKYGWKVGDIVPLRSTIWRQADGSDTWDLEVSAIYSVEGNAGDQNSVVFHYDYFNESRSEGARDLVGWYIVQLDDPERAVEVAAAIDERFANSSAETKTTTEKAFAQSFANQVGNISAIVTAVVTAVFFTMLLVIANTMGQSVRERTRELAVLKTLGFTSRKVTALVLVESVFITALGGVTGLLLAWLFVEGGGDFFRQFLPVFYLPPRDVLLGVALMLVFGLLAGALPASQAMRLRIADALRRA